MRKLTPDEISSMLAEHGRGIAVSVIHVKYGITKGAVYYHIKNSSAPKPGCKPNSYKEYLLQRIARIQADIDSGTLDDYRRRCAMAEIRYTRRHLSSSLRDGPSDAFIMR